MKKKKKLIIWLCIIIGGLLIVAIIKGGDKGKEYSVVTEKAQMRTIMETVSANGKVQPEVEVKISSDVSGEIVELLIKEGDQVKEGDLLVKINPDIYVSARERVEASLNNAKASLAKAKAQFTESTSNFNRNSKLYDEGAISLAEFEQIEAAFQVAKLNVESAEYTVSSALASLKEANDNLVKTSIFAPMDGTVSMLSVEEGERVVGTSQFAGTEMLRIADLSNMEVNVEVNESDIVRVSLKDSVKIEVDAYLDRKFTGLVMEIANSANVDGLSIEQVTTFDVKIRILRESYNDLIPKDKQHLSPFRPGMSATVEVQTEMVTNVLSVPIQAVTTRGDTTDNDKNSERDEEDENDEDEAYFDEEEEEVFECVFVYKDGVAQRHNVETGIQDNKYIRILSGIEKEAEVITAPFTVVSKKLEDGDKVKKVKKSELYKGFKKR